MKKVKKDSLYMLVAIVYACVFLIPELKISGQAVSISKYIFLSYTILVYLFLVFRMKVTAREIVFLAGILIVIVANKSGNSLSLISILVIYKLIRTVDKEELAQVVQNKTLCILSFFGVIAYSVYYLNEDRSYIHTAIHEVNQSGLAIFCLGLIVRKKNLVMGNLILLLGCLTFSRNYYLALLIFVFFNRKIGQRMIERFKLVNRLSFINIFIISTAILIVLGWGYEILYQQGRIVYSGEGGSRLVTLIDYANYYRFTVNIFTIEMFVKNPSLLFTGIPDMGIFQELCHQVAWDKGLLYVGNTSHNFLFASLRLYGICGIFVFGYISGIMKNIVNENNFSIFLSICTYAIFLSVGFNLYWLYLTVFTLLVYMHPKECC